MREDVVILLALIALSLYLNPLLVAVAVVLTALFFAPVESAIEARARGDIIYLKSKTNIIVVAVQREDTVYLLEEEEPLQPGHYTIILDPHSSSITIGDKVCPVRLVPAEKKADYAIYVQQYSS